MIEIAEGEKSPYVLVKPEENKMVIKGNSFMANPPSFYEKVLQWAQTFKATAPLSVEISWFLQYIYTKDHEHAA
ncbi:MAG: DUF1987 family protein [Sphingobacteriaceae bacterium]|nr:DUF1987 family protein [Sphingobacteriaceae bacterium]